MKRYLLIVAGLCLVACGGKDKSKYYLLLNDSSSVLQVNDEQVPRYQCFELRDGEHTSDFPLSLLKISEELVVRNPVEVKEPGHYIWNGSEAVKVEGDDIEEHKKICRDKKKEAAADPNIQASTSPASEAKSDIPRYMIFNESKDSLGFKDTILEPYQCPKLEDYLSSSDFPVTYEGLPIETIEEPGHYIWNGSEVVKVKDEEVEGYRRLFCDENSNFPVPVPLSAFESSPATSKTTEQPIEGTDISGEIAQTEEVSEASKPPVAPEVADSNVQTSTSPTTLIADDKPQYVIFNESSTDLNFNGKIVAANHCTGSGFLSSDFPIKTDEMSLEEPGHYIWNGSAFVKAEEEYIRAVCKEISDPTVQPVSSLKENTSDETIERIDADTPAVETSSRETAQAEAGTKTPESEVTPDTKEYTDKPVSEPVPAEVPDSIGQATSEMDSVSPADTPAITKIAIYSYLQHLSPIMLEKCSQQYGISSIHTFISSDGNICQISEHPLDKCAKERDAWRKKYEDQGFQCELINEIKTPTGACKSNLMLEKFTCAK